jgi:hypothetical protein
VAADERWCSLGRTMSTRIARRPIDVWRTTISNKNG